MAIEVDNLFEALDIIIKQRMEDISYDKTEICTITDDSNAKNGRYWVSPNNGQTRYEAYSESDEYKKGESVRVSILNGDFTQKKFITGKYVVDDAITPMTYVSPLNTVIDVSGNIITGDKFYHQFGLVTNGQRKEIPIWSADLDLDETYRDLQASGIYNTIALSAHFRTLLDNYDMRSGSYGLRLDIYVKVNPKSNKYIVRSVTLDSSEMFGNPYGFVIYSPQAKKFDLSKIGTVEKMTLWYYQNGDFSYYNSDDNKTMAIDATNIYQDNLLMKNVKISFGSDLSVVADNTIQAYSADPLTYNIDPNPETNEKDIGFLWYNKDEVNNYLGFSDGLVDFETRNGETVYENKLTKKWEHATEDVVDETGRVILEFARDEEGKIELVLKRNSSGEPIEIEHLSEAYDALDIEIQTLKQELLKEFENEIILEEEYKNRFKDIEDYFEVKKLYLDTEYSDPKREADINEFYDDKIQKVRDDFSSGIIDEDEADIQIVALEEARAEEIQNLRNYRLEYTYALIGKQQEVFVPRIKHYDELTYLEESEFDSRLTAQSGRENIATDYKSLKIAADLAEAKVLIDKTFDLVMKDMYQVLRNMQQRTSSLAEVAEALNTILTTPKKDASGYLEPGAKNNLNAWYQKVDELRVNMNNVYSQFLAYNYRNQLYWAETPANRGAKVTYLATEEQLKAWVKNKKNLYKLIENEFTKTLIPMLNKFFNDTEKLIQKPTGDEAGAVNYSGYQGIYDTYYKNAKIVAKDIQKNLDKLSELLEDNFDIMKSMPPASGTNNYVYVEYLKKDFSNCANRYSVYWYRYNPKHTKGEDRLVTSEWERMTTREDFGITAPIDTEAMNAALAYVDQMKADGKFNSTEEYEKEKARVEKSYKEVQNYGLPIYDEFIQKDGKTYFATKAIDTNTLATRLMCADRTNPTKEEKFKVILFYNHEMYESNVVVFTNEDSVPDATTVDKSDAIVIEHGENSQDTYQSYGITNYLVNSADANKVRTVSVHYEGLLAGDEALADTQVYWYIPNQATMLTCDDKHLTEELGFASDKDTKKKPDYSKEGYTCYYKKIRTKTVKVKDDPDTDDVNEAKEYTTANEEDLTFTYKIKDYFISTSKRNDIICRIVKGQYTFETSLFLAFTTLGTSGTDYTLAITPSNTQVAVFADAKKPLGLDIDLYDYNNEKLSILTAAMVTEENAATDFQMDWDGPTSYAFLTTEGEYGINGAQVTLVKSPGANDSLIYGVLKASAICPIAYKKEADSEDKKDDNVFQQDVEEDEETGTKQSTRNVELISYYPIPYSVGDYYIEGATTIVYDSMGSNPSYYKDPYKIFKSNTNQNIAEITQDNGDLHYDIKWRIVYYKKNEKGEVVKLNKDTHSDYNMCRNYMPTLNEKNGLNPASMYLGDMDCWCAVECWCKDLSLNKANPNYKYTLLWVQPILILQNRYPSPMLNAWDGSLTIDEKNGTILSSMVGAGRKTRQNTFEGVLMGDIEGSAGIVNAGNKSGLGLYGFHDGAQSFGFNVDGTGFIGKSGRGRIQFDGNEGTIESASYTTGTNPFGMKIDFDDGWIDMRGGVEFEEKDWINYAIDRYNEVLKARKQVVNKETGEVEYVEPVEYIVDDEVMSLLLQEALLAKIEEDAKNLTALYEEAVSVCDQAYLDGKITKDERDRMRKKKAENKYYALTTVRVALLKGEFTVKGKTYDFTKKQYNALMNVVDEALKAETYTGTANGEDQGYKARYGKLSRALQGAIEEGTIQEPALIQSNIHLDVNAPYFYIISEEGKRILNIGKNVAFDKLVYKNSTGETELQTLLEEGYYLKTNNYMPSTLMWNGTAMTGDPGSGMLIDLAGNCIDVYDFVIKGENSSDDYYGSYLQLTSDPEVGFIDAYVYDHHFDGDYEGNHVMLLSQSQYQLCSFDWYNTETVKQGMLIDLTTGTMTAYSNSNEGKMLSLDADNATYPLQIGTITAPNFKIGWDGSLRINDTAFVVDAEGNLSINNGAFAVTNQGQMSITTTGGINIADNFIVTSDGSVTANNITANGTGYIAGWTIGKDSLSKGTMSLSSSGSNGQITAGKFSVDTTGTLEATDATLNTLLVNGKLTVANGNSLTAEMEVNGHSKITGHLGIGTDSHATYLIDVNGKGRISGNFGINTDPSDSFGLTVSGKTKLGGNVGINADPDDNYGLNVSGQTYITGNTGIGTEPDTTYGLKIEGKTFLGGFVSTDVGGTTVTATNGTLTVDGAGVFDDITLTFRNGLLVSISGAGADDNFDGESGTGGSVTAGFGKLAYVDDIKKNFDITASGTYGSTLYVADGTEDYITGASVDIEFDDEGNYSGYDLDYHWGKRTKYKSIGKKVTISGTTTVTLAPNEGEEVESIGVSVTGGSVSI